MKKLYTLLACAVLFAACAGNKNVLNERMNKYPADRFITKIAVGADRNAAQSAALADLKAIFDNVPLTQGSEIRREAILARAKVVQWWRDRSTNRFYAIAALEREGAQATMRPFYATIDGRLEALAQRINDEQDKFLRVRLAMQMQPLLGQREQLDREYRLLTFDSGAFEEDKLFMFRNVFNRAFHDIKINAVMSGTSDRAVRTHLIDALNTLGFGVGENLPNADIELAIETKVTHTTSRSIEGLFWADSTAVVSLKDMHTGGVFATFTKFGRDGSGRADEAQRRSMIAVGADSAPIIKQRILEYIQRR